MYRGQVKGPCYWSRDDHDCKIRARKQRTRIGKYCFANRTVKLWSQLTAEALVTFPCKSYIYRKRVRNVIISEEKWMVCERWWRNVQKCKEVKNGELCYWSGAKCCEVKWSEGKWSEILGKICELSSIYSNVAVCTFCAVRRVIISCFSSLFSNYLTYVLFSILCMFVFYCVYFVILYCTSIVSPLVYSCLFPIFIQVYRPPPPSWNPISVNKYHII